MAGPLPGMMMGKGVTEVVNGTMCLHHGSRVTLYMLPEPGRAVTLRLGCGRGGHKSCSHSRIGSIQHVVTCSIVGIPQPKSEAQVNSSALLSSTATYL